LISADTSSLVAHLQAQDAVDTRKIREAIRTKTLILTPIVITELLSFPGSGDALRPFLVAQHLLDPSDGFWERAGDNRRLLRSKGLKAKLAETLIAQCCIDADVPLIARDSDFRHFEKWCGLKLA
jgi:predicted nucleic acid-binding protein